MDQLEEIRSKIDLVAFISEHVALKKAGRNFRGLCPFHTEKTPSFMVSPERQIFKCFGCQKGGDAFTFLMEMERLEFGEALRILAKRTGVVLQSYQPSGNEAEKEKLLEINHLTAEFYHYLLLNHQSGKNALNYALQRGITKESLIKFKVGYAPDMWDGLQKFLVSKKGYEPRLIEKAGLIIQSPKSQPQTPSHYDRFRNRLMFPLSDHRDNVVGFAGRLLDINAKEAKYVNSPETPLYHKSELLFPLNIAKEAIKKENTAVLVEGEIDAISCYQIGIQNVVAIKGSALTDYQARLIRRFSENVILALDADGAGDMATRRGIEIADKAGLNLRVIEIDKYKDPDEAAQKEPKYLKEKLENPINVYDFIIDSAFKRFRGVTPEEKKKVGMETIPLIAKIEDEILKNIFVKKIANRLGVSEESVVLQIEKLSSNTSVSTNVITQPTVDDSNRYSRLEDYWLALVFQTNKVADLLNENYAQLVTSPINKKIIALLPNYFKEKKTFSTHFFFRILPPELKDGFDKYYLVDFGERIEDPDWCRRELAKTEVNLRELKIREMINTETDKLKSEMDEKESDKVSSRIRELTKQLAQLQKS